MPLYPFLGFSNGKPPGIRSARSALVSELVSAQHLVKRDAIEDFGKLDTDLRLPCRIEATLGYEAVEEAVDAVLIARVGQPGGRCRSLGIGEVRSGPFADGALRRQRIGYFAKSGLDGLLVSRQRRVALRLADRDIGSLAARAEYRIARVSPSGEAEGAPG